ncbi:MAG: MutS-related protein [Candidatus Woesearchaeota archaeon]
MTLSKELIHESYEPIIELNKKSIIISHITGSFLPDSLIYKLPETAIDAQTLKLIQVNDLHKAIDYSLSAVGSASIFRSLIQPSTSLELISAKQESLLELNADNTLRQEISDYLTEYSEGEYALFKFLNKGIEISYPYIDFIRATNTCKKISNASRNIKTPKSKYLASLVNDIQSFDGTRTDSLLKGPIYKTFNGMKSKDEVTWYTPRLRFKPTSFTIGTMSPTIAACAYMAGIALGILERNAETVSNAPMLVPAVMIGPLYCVLLKRKFDYDKVMEPLRNLALSDNKFTFAIESIGKMDELLSYHNFSKESFHKTTLPTISDNDNHFFIAKNMNNPVLAKDDTNFVSNDVNLNGSKVTFITGPNSAGKTTYCKSIIQNQMLAQIGCYVAAEEMYLSIADNINYQAPTFDLLQYEEGRFGFEISRTMEIFFKTTPKSLVVLDELAEGTTYEEKLTHSNYIMRDFNTIGNNTILVTHNHALVELFKDNKIGQYLKGEFDGQNPTHKFIDGISKESHAERVIEKLGFGKAERKKYLAENGYLK